MGFPPELNDQVFTFKSTDLTSALLEAERALGELAHLSKANRSTRAEASDEVRVPSYDPDKWPYDMIRAMAYTLQFAGVMEGEDANARFAAKALRDLDRGVEVLRAVAREFERRADSTEELRLAMIAFNAAGWVLYKAKSLVTIDSTSNDDLADDDLPDDAA